MCAYIQALRSKYSVELIKVFHIVTNGQIYCPVHNQIHEFKEDEKHEKEVH